MMHQWTVVTTPPTWRTSAFHCFDTRSVLCIKAAGPALKRNQLWLWEMMNTVWPLKQMRFHYPELSLLSSVLWWNIQYFYCLAPPVLYVYELTQVRECCVSSFLLSPLGLSPVGKKRNMRETWQVWSQGGALCCDEQQAKLSVEWVRMESRGEVFFGSVFSGEILRA